MPEEALQYDLRLSGTANGMRQRLAAFEPTEQEFLSVFKLQKAFDDEFSMITEGNETPAEQAKRKEAWEQLNEQIQQTLGTERYEDYERAKDFAYQQMYHVAKLAGLGTPEAKQIYAMRKLAEEQAARIRTDEGVAPAHRGTALEAIRRETERSILCSARRAGRNSTGAATIAGLTASIRSRLNSPPPQCHLVDRRSPVLGR
jgi:hypothetical protein